MVERRTALACAAALSGLMLAPQVAAANDITVNDDTTGPGPAGADCTAAAAHTTISSAIAAANPGDRILVCAGAYNESVQVTKTLSLVGAQAGNDARTRTVTPANESVVTGAPSPAADGGIAVSASDVSIDGFLVEGAANPATGSGISLPDGHSDHRVANNVVRDNTIGMYLSNEDGETNVRHNLFDSNNQAGAAGGTGIYGDTGADNVVIDENEFTGNNNAAMVLTASGDRNEGVQFSGNDVIENRSVVITSADDVLIEGNTIVNTDTGDGNGTSSAVYLGGDINGALVADNTISEASTGVRIDNAFFPGARNVGVDVIGNTITENTHGIRTTNGAVGGILDAHFNRIAGNTTAGIDNPDVTDEIDAENNWWGCNEGPNQAGCDAIIGLVDANPWLFLSAAAKRSQIRRGRSTPVNAGVTTNSDGETPEGNAFPDGTSIAFATTRGVVNPATAGTIDGIATTKLRGTERGPATVTATLDNETASTVVRIKRR